MPHSKLSLSNIPEKIISVIASTLPQASPDSKQRVAFRTVNNGVLLPHIAASYLKRIVIIPAKLTLQMYQQGNGFFEVRLDVRDPDEFVNITEPIEVMCSFQFWHDGSKFVVIRKVRS